MTAAVDAATRLWRIAPGRHMPLSGEGARRFGGRWTSPGRPAVYLAAQLPLAALEVLAHVDRDAPPLNLVAYAVDVPTALGVPEAWARWDEQRGPHGERLALPEGWRNVAQPAACRAVGDAWLAVASPVRDDVAASRRPGAVRQGLPASSASRHALLRVPTAVLPAWAEPAGAGVAAGSWCAVFDPTHPDAAHVRVAESHPFAFDPRVLRAER